MKKIVLILLIILLCGCGKKNYIICKSNISNDIQGYTFESNYKIYYKNGFVTKIEKDEKYTSSNQSALQYFDQVKSLEYYKLNDLYGGTTYTIKSEDDNLLIKATIDLSNFDLGQMVKNGDISSDYVVGNKLLLTGVKYIYREKGATCDE